MYPSEAQDRTGDALDRLSAALNARMAATTLTLPSFPWHAVKQGPEALAGALAGPLCRPGELGQLRRRFWRNALREAHIAWHVAKARELDAEGVFTLGLLHRVGRISCIYAAEHVLAEGFVLEPKPLTFWSDLVERHHLEFGLLTARAWGFPTQFSELVALTLPELAEHDSATACLLRIAEQIECTLDSGHQLPEEGLLAVDVSDRDAVKQATKEIPSLLQRFSYDSDVLGDSWALAYADGLDLAQPSGAEQSPALLSPALEQLRDVSTPRAQPTKTALSASSAGAGSTGTVLPFWRRPQLQVLLAIGLILFAALKLVYWNSSSGDSPTETSQRLTRGEDEVITEARQGFSSRDVEVGRPLMVMVDLFLDGEGNLTAEPLGADPDGDLLQYQYTWFRGSQSLEVSGPTMMKEDLVPGSYSVMVRVSDGKLMSPTLRSAPLVIQ
ncbi:MAG: HDOD domain-containing protein [Deltaproteobacteria bacterium]|nr:HDOD domain-containing protein [Deltaproteobacteria bacterium]